MQGNHSFNVNLAATLGVEEAILLQHLHFWCEQNKKANRNFINGKYWTFNSCSAYEQIFPYFNSRKIGRILNSLESQELIESGVYNKVCYDRTKWYTLTKKGVELIKKCITDSVDDLENSDSANANDYDSNVKNLTIEERYFDNKMSENCQPIPDINTNINTNINQERERDEAMNTFEPVIQEDNNSLSPDVNYKINTNYAKVIFDLWNNNELKLPGSKNFISFVNREFRLAQQNIKGIHSNEVIQACKNYFDVIRMNCYYSCHKYDFEDFTKHIKRFLPDYYNPEEYKNYKPEKAQIKETGKDEYDKFFEGE